MLNKKQLLLPAAVALVSVVFCGCDGLMVTKPTAARATLKFREGDSTEYKVKTKIEKSVEMNGEMQGASQFKGGTNIEQAQMNYIEHIQEVKENGNAVAKIVIDGLKYYSTRRGREMINFDSSTEKNPDAPLMRLVGQHYIIELTPQGEVVDVRESKDAKILVSGPTREHRAALRLLEDEVIKERHGFIRLDASEESKVKQGDSWSGLKTFDFGMMGSETYEKIYTADEITRQDGNVVLISRMEGAPTAEGAESGGQDETRVDFSQMPNIVHSYTYTGNLKMDVTEGKILNSEENLESKWVIMDPSAQQDSQEAAAVIMTAKRYYSLEKVD